MMPNLLLCRRVCLIAILFAWICAPLAAQDTPDPDPAYFYTKDGMKVDTRVRLIDECAKSMENESIDNPTAQKICGCMLEIMFDQFTAVEFIAMDSGGGFDLDSMDPELKQEMELCVLNVMLSNETNTPSKADPNAALDPQYIYTKDGLALPRDEVVKECASSLRAEQTKLYKEPEKVCTCLAEMMIGSMTFDEISQIGLAGDHKNLPPDVLKKAEECANENLSADTKFSDLSSLLEQGPHRQLFLQRCQEEAMAAPGISIDSKLALKYCECSLEKLLKSSATFGDLENLDLNSPLAVEMIGQCIREINLSAANNAPTATQDAPSKSGSDVLGSPTEQAIPTISYNGTTRVKISIGGIEKYFLLDTGASDMIISSVLERELLREGIISKKHYTKQTETYKIADGSQVTCPLIVLESVQIGSFTVQNVKAAIMDSKDASLLLGQSFLDKFSEWKFDKSKEQLLLKK
ncbi:MAG: clan AA aspartic protease [Sphingobacteriales bacterium]|nr:clan AA aspartic protease [Sphingobacteriales bacterium]MCC7224239.1 clan AA aspartic protease [Chitinophagales bacterium]